MPHRAQLFRLKPPTTESALQALSRVLGDQRAQEVFAEVASEEGISPDELRENEVESLHQIASQLALREGIISVLGLALQIRCETYLALNASEVHS